jgi:endonuclease/exonuclease/phosphatase family metal-dependent hydrolase
MTGDRLLKALVVLFVSGCATPRIQLMNAIPSVRPLTRSDIKVVTYNVGLAPGIVRLAKQRTAAVAEELGRLDYDVLCLQEVWTEDDQDAILMSLNLPSENVYRVDTRGEGETGKDVCKPGQIQDIMACTQKKCSHEPPEELATCAASECVEEGIMLYLRGRECLNCLTATAGKNVDDVVKICTGQIGASRIYDGGNGVVLASRWPLLEKGVVHLPSSGANRVALMATVDVPGKGKVEVACTHLSAKNDVSPTNPAFSDWTEEQQTQLRLIAEKLAFRATGRPQLLIGDLNFGQRNDKAAIVALMWSTWRLAADLGFVSPAEYAEPGFCSWCHENWMTHSSDDHLIDHILVRNPVSGQMTVPVCAYRMFDRPISVTDWKGRPSSAHFSDHFGVTVELNIR